MARTKLNMCGHLVRAKREPYRHRSRVAVSCDDNMYTIKDGSYSLYCNVLSPMGCDGKGLTQILTGEKELATNGWLSQYHHQGC